MGAAADLPQRSSSPLKRPASSMEPETDNMNAKEDVAMNVDNDSATRAVNQEPVQKETGNDEAMDATPLSPKEPTTEPNGLPLRNDIPPLDQQIKTIETLVKAFAETPIQDGDQAYLVSRQWLQRAQAFGLDSKHVSKEVPEGTLGPVDNSDIIQAIFTDSNGVECVKLKPGLGTESFELFPKDAWDLLLSWYGLVPGQAPVIRFAHNTAPDAVSEPVIQFEFHPPVFTIHRLWSATSPIPIEQEIKLKKPGPPIVVQSTSFSYHKFLKQVKSLAGVATDRKVRVWRVLQTIPATEATAPEPSEPSGMMKTPPDSPIQGTSVPNGLPVVPGAWPEMLVDVVTFLQLEKDVQRALVEAEDTTTNANYNGKKSLSLIGLNVDQTLVLDEEIERNMYISTFINRNLNDKNPATRNSSTALVQARANTSGRSSPALSAPLTRGRAQQKPGRTNGCVGLQNLGNTCYMNSALQCLRAVEELTKYFLTKEAQKEINADNPLSHNGDVAVAYGRLLDEIYRDPTPNSIAPRQFKSVIGRYAPTFSGYGQQDSQEFLGWLLDGLQEDLNRILKKPYIEKPDSTDEMINNPAAIREMALKVWDITKKRDDSVIADLFTGLYKSTLVCPECNKISITFDPFNNLTLPLPMANSWSRTVKFYPLNEPPVQIVVDIDKNSSFKTMKQFISQRVGVPVDRLMASEEYSGKFFKHYDDLSTVSEEITSNDIATVHELEAPPSNLELTKQAKKPKYKSLLSDNDEDDMMEDPMAQSMVVPVLHIGIHGKNKGKNNKGGSLPPHFIILTPDEACSEDIIRRKVLEKVATFTTHPGLATVEEADAGDNIDPEMVNMASDVDSRDSNITAKSVEGEEDIVDVTMADAGEAPKPAVAGAAEQSPQLLKVFKHQRPKWMNPKEFLDPEFQNLFELSFFTEGGANSIPTGWSSVNDGNAHARLSTRQPKPIVSDVEMQSPGAWPNSDESGSEEVNEATRMADESSEDDSDFPHVKNLQPRSIGPVNQVSTRGGKKKVKPRQQTYSKKGKKRFEKQQKARVRKQQASTPDFGPVEGPLVRLGEGIIVEWNENAWEVLFEGTPGEPMRGCKTYENLDTLVDPALEVKKKQRLLRKKHGIALDDCLDEFEKEEILSEQDTWYCPRCKEHRRASKKFDLWKTPDILVVHLKRFSSSGFRREKLDTLVDFPVEGLDLTSRVIDKEDGKQEIYDLIAVDDHWGGLGGGHYTAFAKNFNDGLWYEYNDTSVSKCSDPQKVVTPAAYLLFYRRRSDEPLGGLRFHEILDKYDNQVAAADQDMSDSGEGQRLGQGSSLRGSPSASTGAGLTLPQGKRGLVSDDSDRTGRALVLADAEPPSYQASITNVDEDTEMGAVLWDQTTLHNSIEGDEDEGIGLPDYDNGGMAGMTSVISPSWNFSNIKAGSAASDGDIASDIAQNDNSSLDDAFAAGDDMDEVFMGAPTIGFVEPEPTFPDEDIPAPPAEAQNFLDQIAEDKWAQQQIHTVPVNIDDDQASDKVAEIRVGDNGDNGDNGDTGGTGEAHVQKPSV